MYTTSRLGQKRKGEGDSLLSTLFPLPADWAVDMEVGAVMGQVDEGHTPGVERPQDGRRLNTWSPGATHTHTWTVP